MNKEQQKLWLPELLMQALPPDLDPETLLEQAPDSWWTLKPTQACEIALRRLSELDWEAYLNFYPDIRDAGLDPIAHFLEKGLFEGRKLFSRKAGCSEQGQNNNSRNIPEDIALGSRDWHGHSLFDIVRRALPDDIDPANLRQACPEKLWQLDPRQACGTALRKCDLLDWNAYLTNNEDVKNAAIDPVKHFLDYGIIEHRKLFSRHELCGNKESNSDNPKVSVIVPNYNNALYLEKCFNSLVHQTLHDIEIIVVDDCSTDNSLEIIKRFAESDNRIIIIRHETNLSLHMVRKTGVNYAHGDYIMFLDSDDFYELNACEKAWQAISLGYDLVCYKTHSISHNYTTIQQAHRDEIWRNRMPAGEYSRIELLDAIFKDRLIPISSWAKICSTPLCKKAFAMLEDGYYANYEDLYEMLSVISLVRKGAVIDDMLCNHVLGVGGSRMDGSPEQCQRYMRMGKLFAPIQRFAETNRLNRYIEPIKTLLFQSSVRIFIEYGRSLPDWARQWLPELATQFGALYTALSLLAMWRNNPHGLAEKIVLPFPGPPPVDASGNINEKKIGIFYYFLGPGGIETSVRNICFSLCEHGYEVTVFIEEKSDYDVKLPDGVRLCRLQSTDYKLAGAEAHLRDLYDEVKNTGITTMFYMATYKPITIFDLILLKTMNIGVIGSHRTNLACDLINQSITTPLWHRLNLFRLMDKVFCLSPQAELFLRANSIDAVCIPNMIPVYPDVNVNNYEGNTICVIARLADRMKCIRECLFVLNEILQIQKNVKMRFIGDFNDENVYADFRQTLSRLNLADHVEVTGWTNDIYAYINDCKVLFSASYVEGFPNGIAEALAIGKPVVMYGIPIMLTENNQAIISVPQGDYKQAAKEIIKLMCNNSYRHHLANAAQTKAREFSQELFAQAILTLLDSYRTVSYIEYNNVSDWINIINNMAFYAERSFGIRDLSA